MPEARMCDLRFISQPVADVRHPDVYEYRRLIVFKFNIYDFVDSVGCEQIRVTFLSNWSGDSYTCLLFYTFALMAHAV